jgi:hypothetical protein
VDYRDYLDLLRSHADGWTLREYGAVEEAGRRYPLVTLSLGGPAEALVTSGFHGEEPAGPLTLAQHLGEIREHARMRGVGVRLYPCANPAGFEAGTRYNPSGERPNNDFLRYETAPGVWTGELQDGEPFLAWRVFLDGPKETRALAADLERHPTPAAALDIHQDNFLPGVFTYAYVFGDRSRYAGIMHARPNGTHVAASLAIDDRHHTDGDGLIVSHDGSVTDYFLRRGATWAAALETTTATPLTECHAINLAWIRGFIDLAAERAPQPPVAK